MDADDTTMDNIADDDIQQLLGSVIAEAVEVEVKLGYNPMPHGYHYLIAGDGKPAEEVFECNEFIADGNLIIRDATMENPGVFRKFESIAQYLARYPEDSIHLTHEVIPAHMIQKIKFDIDGGNKELFKDFLEIVEAAMVETYDCIPEFVICDSSDSTKFSRHILINNVAAQNTSEVAYFAQQIVKPMTSEELKSAIDWDVYKGNQCFRTVGSTKDGRLMKVAKPHTRADTFVTLCRGLKVLPLIAPIPSVSKQVANVDPTTLSRLEKSIDLSAFDYSKRSKGNMIVFDRKKTSYCDICARTHDRAYMYVCVFENSARRFCSRDTSCPKKNILVWTEDAPAETPIARTALHVALNASNILNRDHRVFFGGYTQFLDRTFNDLTPVKTFIADTIAYIVNGGDSFYITKNLENGEQVFKCIKEFTMRDELAIRGTDGKVKGRKFRDIIVDTHKEISYDGMEFIPFLREPSNSTHTSKIFNTFAGYRHAYDPAFTADETKFDLILRHIREVWCNDDATLYEYVLNWMAHLVQNPTRKMNVAILLKSSAEGAGKNSVCEFFGKYVIGARYLCMIDDIDNLVGRFNAHLENKLFTVCDEIQNYGGAYKSNDKLKSIITRTILPVEAKGFNIRQTADHNNYVFLTNNDWAIKVGQTDRRYLALELNNRYADQKEYFDPLYGQLNDISGLHFFHWIAGRNIENWHANPIPLTDLKRELRSNSLAAPIKFIADLYNGEVDNYVIPEEGELKVTSLELYRAFCNWKDARGILEHFTDVRFSKEISKIQKSKAFKVNGSSKCGHIYTRVTLAPALIAANAL